MLRKRDKKGQITIFVIIAIVIVAGVVTIFTVNKDARNFVSETFLGKDENIVLVEDHINFCLKEALDRSLFYNGLQGGYFITPDSSLYFEDENLSLSRYIPYYLDKGKKILTKEQLSEELGFSIKNNFQECLDLENQAGLEDIDLEYNLDRVEVKNTLNADKIKTEINFPMSINIEDKQILLERFNTEKETNYLLLYVLAIELTDIQIEHENNICLSCISTLAKDNSLNIDNKEAKGINENEYVVVYTLNKYNKNKENEAFSFAHKFYRGENEN